MDAERVAEERLDYRCAPETADQEIAFGQAVATLAVAQAIGRLAETLERLIEHENKP